MESEREKKKRKSKQQDSKAVAVWPEEGTKRGGWGERQKINKKLLGSGRGSLGEEHSGREESKRGVGKPGQTGTGN